MKSRTNSYVKVNVKQRTEKKKYDHSKWLCLWVKRFDKLLKSDPSDGIDSGLVAATAEVIPVPIDAEVSPEKIKSTLKELKTIKHLALVASNQSYLKLGVLRWYFGYSLYSTSSGTLKQYRQIETKESLYQCSSARTARPTAATTVESPYCLFLENCLRCCC